MSNQSWRGTVSRYSFVTLAPLASFFGPPLATLPSSIFSIRAYASFSTIRSWSFRSFR